MFIVDIMSMFHSTLLQ